MSDLSFALESSNRRQCHGWHVPCWEQSPCAACVVPHHRTCKCDLQVTEDRGREAELTEFAAHADKIVAMRKRDHTLDYYVSRITCSHVTPSGPWVSPQFNLPSHLLNSLSPNRASFCRSLTTRYIANNTSFTTTVRRVFCAQGVPLSDKDRKSVV